MSTFAYSFLKA